MKKGFKILLSLLILSACQPLPKKKIFMTVEGEKSVDLSGICLVHEHIMVDWIGADSTGYHRWNRKEVVDRALPFLLEAKTRGVKTFFDCTPAYLGRDPLVLKELAEKSGINIVTNTGYYGAVNSKFLPKSAFTDSPEAIAQIWIDEFKNGIDGTHIRPGFIKISVEITDTLSSLHRKLVEAAAITHKATGLTIVSHTGFDGPAFAQLDVLKKYGVSPEAFVWTHAQLGSIEGLLRAAKMGAWISLDNVENAEFNGKNRIDWFVETLAKFKKENLLHKVLISHDAGQYNVGQPNGGKFRGYTEIFDLLIPALKQNNFSQKDIETLLIENPRKALAISVRSIEI
ncbi:MAG: hypothetical protein N2662_02030 [Bacteroidales bacterium]|nr:hypothetical protein [Bacteroidales bacterium]